MKRLLQLLLCLALLTGASAWAVGTCGTAGKTGTNPYTADSVSQANLTSCLSQVVSGDTINIPAGTATWSSIVLPAKDLYIVGASIITCTGGSSAASPVTCSATNNTNITCTGGKCFLLPHTANHDISGFSFTGASGKGGFESVYGGTQTAGKHFRIHHNRIAASVWSEIQFFSGANCVFPSGLVDNNILIDISIQPQGSDPGDGIGEGSTGNCADNFWTQVPPISGPYQVVYLERNHIQSNSSNVNSADSSMGGRYVARFNNVTSGRHTFESHPVQGNNRGSQWSEVYENNQQGLVGFSGTANWRGGTGIIFNNKQAAAYSFGITLQNDRSEGGVGAPFGDCDGTHPGVDGNTGTRGYPCRDQPGRGYDTTPWVASPPGTYTQVLMPIYAWGNRSGASAMDISASSEGDNQVHIVINRDFFCDVGNASCGTGVRTGTKAQMQAASCSVNQAWWVTDEGYWNQMVAGADGALYRCTATNVWTPYYVPLTYPHPLASGLAAPTGLTVQ
jgi:hypothetical protein